MVSCIYDIQRTAADKTTAPIYYESRIAKVALNAAELPKSEAEFEEIAAGVGFTIADANHVIHLERHWNPAKEAQATDRVYSRGQTRDVLVHVPIHLFGKIIDAGFP